MTDTLPPHQSRAVRALVLLHDEKMRRWLHVWRQARAAGIALPQTDDPSYASLDTLGRHVLRASRGYVTWICDVLQLSDPDIRPTPEAADVAKEADDYLEHLLSVWRTALKDVRGDQLDRPEYKSRWGTLYCIDAMLEHAVMHPIRHTFQLEGLLRAAGRTEG